MAMFSWSGLDQYTSQWSEMSDKITDINHDALYVGAGILADAINAQIDSIPANCLLNDKEKDELHKALYIRPHEEDEDGVHTWITFAGYNNMKSKRYDKGTPILLIARSICAGSSLRKGKYDFVKIAVKQAEEKAGEAMDVKIKQGLEKIQNK